MASVSSVNTVNVNDNKSYISDPTSGVSTDSIVESLLPGTQTKIDKQTSLRQQPERKQKIYRDLITKTNTFGDQYLSYYDPGQTSLLSISLFKIMARVSSSSTVKISSAFSNTISSMRVSVVKRLTAACSVKTAGTVTGEPRGNDVDLTNFADVIGKTKSSSVALDGMSGVIDFTVEGKLSDPADPNPPEEVDEEKTLRNIDQVLYRSFGTSVGMEFEEDPPNSKKGTMKLVQLNASGAVTSDAVDSSRQVIIEATGDSGSSNIIANLESKGGFSNKLDCGTSLKDMNFPTPLQGNRLGLGIGGATVKGLNGGSTLSGVISAISSNDTGVKVSYSPASDKFIMGSSSTGEILNIKIGQRHGNLLTTTFEVKATGLQPNIFSKPIEETGHMDLSSVISKLDNGKDQPLVLQMGGQDFTVKLEGKTGGESYKDEEGLINTINSELNKEFSYGKIVFSWDDINKQVTLKLLEHKVGLADANLITGIASDLGLSEKDNVYDGSTELSSLGVTGDIKVGNITYHLGDSSTRTISDLAGIMGGAYVDGRINMPGQTGDFTVSDNAVINGMDLVENLLERENMELTPVSNTLASNSVSNPTILKGTLELIVPGGSTITINTDSLTNGSDDLAVAVRAEIGGNVIYTVDGRLQIGGIAGKSAIKGMDDDGKELLNQLFSQDTVTFNPYMTASVTPGQNAVLTVDGTDIERNTNAFELDGTAAELTSTYDASNPPISLTTSRDTDKIIDSLKNLVDDYNVLIEELNKQLAETANYKKYAPPMDTQKKEMSDKEVELWEEKPKWGLPHSDSSIPSFLSEVRMALYNSVGDVGLSLYDVGIETSDSWRDNGKLVINKDALRSVVATSPDTISKLFVDRGQGLGIKIQNTIEAAANVSSGSPRSMVRYVGAKDVLLTSNALYEEMKRISETFSNPNTKYELEKTRYWKRLIAMEQATSNMNSRNPWLVQQFPS